MEENTGKRSKKGNIVTAAFFAFSLIVVAVIAIIEFGGKKDRHLENADFNVLFLFAGIGCFIVALICETLKYSLMLKAKGHKRNASLGFTCAVIGKYYDNITPSGAGGQGLQMYHLKKNGCDDGTAGSLPIIGFLGLQFSFVFIAILTVIFGNRYISDELLAIKITAIVGIVFYAFVPVCIIIFAIAPKALEAIVRWGMRVLHKIRIIKNPEASIAKAIGSLRSYSEALRSFGKDYKMIAIVFGISFIYQCALMSMPFFVLHFFGATMDFITCFCRVVYIYAAITVILTPGNSGAAEASFYMVFNTLDGGAIFWGMLVWRALCYYSWIVIGAIIQFRDNIITRQRELWHKLPCEKGSAGLFVDVFYPHIDGVVTTVDAYASNIPGSYVVVPGPEQNDYLNKKYDILRTAGMPGGFIPFNIPLPGLSGKVKKYIRTHRTEVLHAHSPFPIGRMAIKYGRRLGVPVVTTFHSKYYDDFMNVTHSPLISRLAIKYYIVPFYEKCDEVWACSADAARTLKDYGYKGRVSVMENGTDMVYPENSERLREETRNQYSIPQDEKVILYVGQMIWHKNLKLVFDTCSCLKEMGEQFKLVIAGEGYNSSEIIDYCREIGLYEQTLFLGQIKSRIELRNIYIMSDLFFLPSMYDTFSITLREAAALGVCALLLKGSSASKCVTDGVNGFVGPDDSRKMAEIIIRIFADGSYKTVGDKARHTIPVSWSDICKEASGKYSEISKEAGIW